MKRLLTLLLIAAMLCSLASCNTTDESAQGVPQESPKTSTAVPSMSAESAQPSQEAQVDVTTGSFSDEKILIAYFTWAENTNVEDPSAIDTDATTSASLLLPGNTAKLAGWIQEQVGGDMFSIVVEEPYSSDYDECLNRAADEKAANARPTIINHVENMDDYDIVFLGFPNWWYTVPMAIHTFLEEYDFTGKTIVPFVTHGTGGLSNTIQDISANLPDSVTILEPIGVYRPEVDTAQPAILEWIAGLDLNID